MKSHWNEVISFKVVIKFLKGLTIIWFIVGQNDLHHGISVHFRFIITLQFNEDLTAEARNAVADLDVSIGASGFTIPCPTEFEIETNTYTYSDGVVSFLNEDGTTVNALVSISGDIMTVNASSLEIPDFDETGELVFKRQ